MSDSNRKILSHLSEEELEFSDRTAEIGRIVSLTHSKPENRLPSIALLLGAPRTGKSEILRKSFDRLFDQGGETLPFFYELPRDSSGREGFAHDCFAQFLAQFVAFRRNDPSLIPAPEEALAVINRAALAQDHSWIKQIVDSFVRAQQAGDTSVLVRAALSLPARAAAHTSLKPLVMIDNFDLVSGTELQSEFVRAFGTGSPNDRPGISYVITGRRRVLTRSLPADGELFDRIEVIHLQRMADEIIERFIRTRADLLGIETSEATIGLMTRQLNCDFFYTRAILDAAGTSGSSLKTFIDFERLYTDEVRNGRIGHYLDAILRNVAPSPSDGRAALEVLALAHEAAGPVPVDAVSARLGEHYSDIEALLDRLHTNDLLEVSYGFISGSGDPVLADYAREKYRTEVVGRPRPIAGEELLGEKLKDSHRIMMSRFDRGVEAQLVELLSRFDFQNVPASIFDEDAFDKRYRGETRVQIRRLLDEEQEQVRLPQIVLVRDLDSGEHPGVNWRLFTATGFEGGIYSEANEVLWVVALINSKEPLDVETLGRIDQRLEPALRGQRAATGPMSQSVRWYISKEGFSAVACERLSSLHAYRSSYVQLDLLQDHLTRLALGEGARPASEFELVIPIEDEAELIAARTAEQIARAADFDQEAINQIKTALIEACINAAEHSDSPDRKIHQRFAIDEDRLIITVSNRGKTFGSATTPSAPKAGARSSKGRGRGLQIIRALMDEVEFERTDDGARLVMTKYLKRPGK